MIPLALLALSVSQPPAASQPPPRLLPPAVTAPPPPEQSLTAPPVGADPSVRLPLPEVLHPVHPDAVRPERVADGWVVRLAPGQVRGFGEDQRAANDLAITIRTMRVNQWGAIGTQRSVVEYGLLNAVAPPIRPPVKAAAPLDLLTVRAESTRGVWVVRDDAAILLNFGADRPGAEQAAAVAKRYGFNRVGFIGSPTPALAYFYVDRDAKAGPAASGPNVVTATLQEQALTRTGVPIAGTGYVGERVVIQPRKVEVRKDRGEWVLAHGPDVFARFGQSEWTARDALKVVQDGRFTEFCRVGGMTFFLANGAAPTRVPFNVKGTSFVPADLVVRGGEGRWVVCERAGRPLFTTGSEAEARQIVEVLTAYKFDTVCRVGLGSQAGLQFLARTSGR